MTLFSRCGKAPQTRQAPPSLPITVGALPAVLGNIEDHAVGIFELALEIAVALLAEIEEEFAAIGFDALLRLGKIVHLKAEMVGADMRTRIFQIGSLAAGGAGEIEQCEIDDAIAHIDRRTDVQVLASDALELKHVLIEFRGLIEVLYADGKMAQPGHGRLLG